MNDNYLNRFEELEQTIDSVKTYKNPPYGLCVEPEGFIKLVTNCLNLISLTFGIDSIHYKNMDKVNKEFKGFASSFNLVKGIFYAAKEDYIGGYYKSLTVQISGEIFGDFIRLAKESLANNSKDTASVLACAALEDALKKYALVNGVDVSSKDMSEVVNTLKSKGLVSGAQKSLLDVMPKIRNYAMHANWEKITSEDVNSVIGFVEQFLLSKF